MLSGKKCMHVQHRLVGEASHQWEVNHNFDEFRGSSRIFFKTNIFHPAVTWCHINQQPQCRQVCLNNQSRHPLQQLFIKQLTLLKNILGPRENIERITFTTEQFKNEHSRLKEDVPSVKQDW